MRRQTPEEGVKAAVCEFLALEHIRYHRLNAGRGGGDAYLLVRDVNDVVRFLRGGKDA